MQTEDGACDVAGGAPPRLRSEAPSSRNMPRTIWLGTTASSCDIRKATCTSAVLCGGKAAPVDPAALLDTAVGAEMTGSAAARVRCALLHTADGPPAMLAAAKGEGTELREFAALGADCMHVSLSNLPVL